MTVKKKNEQKKSGKGLFPQRSSVSGGGDNSVGGGHHYKNLQRHILREPPVTTDTQASPSPHLCSLMRDATLHNFCLYSVVACSVPVNCSLQTYT